MSTRASLVPLAVAGSPLLLPLKAVASETSSSDIGNHLVLLMIVAALGIIVLAILSLRRLASVLDNDEQGTPGERFAAAEPDELVLCMRDGVEQLDCIAAALRTAMDALSNALDNSAIAPKYASRASNEGGTLLPTGQDSGDLRGTDDRAPACIRSHERTEGNRSTATAMEDIADRIGLIDEISSQTDRLALSVAAAAARIGSRASGFREVATDMRMLAGHGQRKAREIGAAAKSSVALAERACNLLINDTSPTRPSRRNARHLVFTIGDEHFAVSTLSIKEILVASQLTVEPSMPPGIRGAVALRGARVPVIDLGARIGKTPIEIDLNARILAIEVTTGEQPQVLGVAVDSVCEVLHIARADIEPPTAFDSRIRNDFALGIAKVDGRSITVLDLSRGFSVNELVVLRSAAHSTEQRNMLT